MSPTHRDGRRRSVGTGSFGCWRGRCGRHTGQAPTASVPSPLAGAPTTCTRARPSESPSTVCVSRADGGAEPLRCGVHLLVGGSPDGRRIQGTQDGAISIAPDQTIGGGDPCPHSTDRTRSGSTLRPRSTTPMSCCASMPRRDLGCAPADASTHVRTTITGDGCAPTTASSPATRALGPLQPRPEGARNNADDADGRVAVVEDASVGRPAPPTCRTRCRSHSAADW